MSRPAIEISGLVKTFGDFRALDGLDLEVATGEVHGFLGPNGAGKSTTIRVLLGLLRKSGERRSMLGGDPWADAVELHRRLAYVPGDVNLWPKLTGGEAIDLLGRLRGGLDPQLRAELLERFELDPTKKGRAYSKGNRQKVALVAALASDAELLVLDEPTSGLDPLKEAVFQACIEETRAAGRTVLLSSHILAEVEALCDRVTIIRAGKTVETGRLSELRHLTRTSIAVETVQAPEGLDRLPGVHDLHVEDHRARFDVDTSHLDETVQAARRLRRAQPHQHAADARGAVPAPLRRRDRMSALAGARPLLALALRRERVRIPVYVRAVRAAGRRDRGHQQADVSHRGHPRRLRRDRRGQPRVLSRRVVRARVASARGLGAVGVVELDGLHVLHVEGHAAAA